MLVWPPTPCRDSPAHSSPCPAPPDAAMAGLMQAQRVGSSAFQGTAVMMRPVRVAQPFRPAVVPVVAAKTLQGKVLSTDMTKTAVSSEHRRACPQNCLTRCGLLRGAGECWTPGHLSPVATVAAGRRGAAACPPLLAAAQRRLSTWATGAQQGIPFAAGGQRLGAEALRGGASRCTCGPGSGAAAGGGTRVLPVWQRRAGCSWPGWGGPGQKARGHVCHACARLWSIGAPCRPPPTSPPPHPPSHPAGGGGGDLLGAPPLQEAQPPVQEVHVPRRGGAVPSGGPGDHRAQPAGVQVEEVCGGEHRPAAAVTC